MTHPTRAEQPARPANALFPLGHMVATPGALDALDASDQAPLTFLRRHVLGVWGEVCKEDGRATTGRFVRRPALLRLPDHARHPGSG